MSIDEKKDVIYREKTIRQGIFELIENVEEEFGELKSHIDIYMNLFKKYLEEQK